MPTNFRPATLDLEHTFDEVQTFAKGVALPSADAPLALHGLPGNSRYNVYTVAHPPPFETDQILCFTYNGIFDDDGNFTKHDASLSTMSMGFESLFNGASEWTMGWGSPAMAAPTARRLFALYEHATSKAQWSLFTDEHGGGGTGPMAYTGFSVGIHADTSSFQPGWAGIHNNSNTSGAFLYARNRHSGGASALFLFNDRAVTSCEAGMYMEGSGAGAGLGTMKVYSFGLPIGVGTLSDHAVNLLANNVARAQIDSGDNGSDSTGLLLRFSSALARVKVGGAGSGPGGSGRALYID